MDKWYDGKSAQLLWLKPVIGDLKNDMDSDKEQSQICLTIVSHQWSRYEGIQWKSDDLINERENLSSEILESRCRAETHNKVHIKKVPETRKPTQPNWSTSPNVRLLKLEIKKYDGNPGD
ncbi:hypothetical protein T4B_9517 [Trichinella pseudospiralis]|uniref:Uncharacterized protein n=1 Tax=Trichinella pseudospiralis TaxID=6337 RepID=A0A0V1GU15_TRIPS|nr:hypothetical protein T4A_10322 [Trichinella pseudospiralis]KRY69846.1 hypothetical protein T4A_4653 [Trichinella pseudospiralis]KRZ01878.1 hypothetical protein T4B_9517 [Trichinella pseudospiralis]